MIIQCDHIGRVLKVQGKKFLTKLAKIFGDFGGNFQKHFKLFKLKSDAATFGTETLWKISPHFFVLIPQLIQL